MKYIITIVIAIVAITVGVSQNITESVISFKEKYNPLFSSESAILSMEYLKTYPIDGSDTSYYFILDIKNKSLELDNISLGSTIFNLNWVSSSSENTYKINKIQNQSILEKAKFLEFYECISKVYKFTAEQERFKKSKNDIVSTCGVENISIGGEYTPNKALGNKIAFYFKVGEETTYEMTNNQFKRIVKVFRDIRTNWISIE